MSLLDNNIDKPPTSTTLRRLGFIQANGYWFQYIRMDNKDFRYCYYPDSYQLTIECYTPLNFMPNESYKVHTEIEMHIYMDWEWVKTKLIKIF